MSLFDSIRQWLHGLPEEQQRRLQDSRSLPDGRIEVAGRVVVDFASNDYLGLADHPELQRRASQWMQQWGSGSRASRLVSGNLECLSRLEEKLARLKGTESALIFGSGFQANSSVLAALVDRRLTTSGPATQVFTDRLCHACFHFGLAAARVRQSRYRHNDLQHLQELLDRKAGHGPSLIATESVFSMDGDRLNVPEIRRLARRYGALLYVDEAHATGVCGSHGMGLMSVSASDPAGEPATGDEVVTGTFGKALGSYGAYVACPAEIRQYLINRCAGLIYSTALPPMVLGAIDAALDLVPDMHQPRRYLQDLSDYLRDSLHSAGFDTLCSDTHIVPVLIRDEGRVMQLASQLLDAGFLVAAIRPPTVPEDAARLRVSLSAVHDRCHVQGLVQALLRFAPAGAGA
jgi:8-amino-7-oxononanoate synthase